MTEDTNLTQNIEHSRIAEVKILSSNQMLKFVLFFEY